MPTGRGRRQPLRDRPYWRVATPANGWLVVVVLLVVVFYAATLRAGHNWGDDFAQYIRHAQNLLEGRTYTDIADPTRSRFRPPAFPSLLLPIYALRGLDLHAMKLLNLALFATALVLLYQLFRRELPESQAIAVVGLMGFHPFFWEFKDEVLSEPLYLVLSTVALLLAVRLDPDSPQGGRPKPWSGVGVGVALYLAYASRRAALVLVGAVLAAAVMRRWRVTKATALAAVTFAVALLLQRQVLESGLRQEFAVPPLVFGSTSLLEQVQYYSIVFADFWENGFSDLLEQIILIGSFGCAITSVMDRLRVRVTVFELFPPLYIAALLANPAQQGMRYLVPLIPFWLFHTVRGAKLLVDAMPARARRVAVAAAWASVALTYGGSYARADFGPVRSGPTTEESAQLFAWVREYTHEDDALLFIKPRALTLFTGRSATHYTRGNDFGYWRDVHAAGATYLVTGPPGVNPYLQVPIEYFVQRNASRFEAVYANPDFTVYRIHRAFR